MTTEPSVQARFQRLLDEMLALLEEYEQASVNDSILSVKKELRIKIKRIQREIDELSQLQHDANRTH